jgi:hypothetical protein
MFTAKTNVNFPAMPEKIEQAILEIAHDSQKPFLSYEAGAGIFECKPANKEILQWALRNLSVPLRSMCVQTIRAGDFDAHVDGPTANGPPRDYNLMYVIEPGGECVTTNFYKTTDELINLAGKNLILPEQHRELLETFEFMPRQWIIMNNQCFHKVAGITGLRVGLSISLYKKDCGPDLVKLVSE